MLKEILADGIKKNNLNPNDYKNAKNSKINQSNIKSNRNKRCNDFVKNTGQKHGSNKLRENSYGKDNELSKCIYSLKNKLIESNKNKAKTNIKKTPNQTISYTDSSKVNNKDNKHKRKQKIQNEEEKKTEQKTQKEEKRPEVKNEIENFNFNIINDITNLKTEENKNNESIWTQDTSNNINFSLISTPKGYIKLSDEPKGLYNFSLNCYMNSLLQCFYHIKGLRASFIDPSKYSKETQKVCYSLSEVMKGLTDEKENYYSPNNFKQTLGEINKLFAGHKGADVSDLYRTVIDSIIDEIPYEYPEENEDYENKKQNYEEAKKDVDPNNPINKELTYFYETIYRCPEGYNDHSVQNDSSIVFELLKISEYTNGKIDINKCFDYNFREISNNEFFCSKCNCTHTSTSRDKLLSLPKVLALILNRGKGKQFVDKVEFGEKINIQEYVDDTFIEPEKRKYNYRLIGVSTHSGSSSSTGGHYIAYCYREKEQEYYCFNDTSTYRVTFDEIKKYAEPYILFYEQTNDIIK
jgi:ubiquitin C-terminal hydrolase